MKTRLTIALFLTILPLAGCVSQKMAIRSDPPGARVFWNGEEKGVTPCEFDFLWYGHHKVTLEKEGYERLTAVEDVKCPPYLYVPVDLAVALIPANITDRQELSYTLTPVGPGDGVTGTGAVEPADAEPEAAE